MNISVNNTLLELVENKRVALIGPAPYLTGKGLGSLFDSYDIVCRPNEVIPQEDMRKDYGSRTDIMFCNFGTPWMRGIQARIKEGDTKEHLKNLKLVIASAIKSDHSEHNYLSWPDNYVSKVVKNFESINEYNLPFYWIGVKDYKTLHKEIGTEFNTGVAAISMLSKYPIKEILITGFTLYTGGKRYEDVYRKGYIDEIDKKRVFSGGTFGHGDRAAKIQMDYIKRLTLNLKDVIKLDTKVNAIIGTNHSNIQEI